MRAVVYKSAFDVAVETVEDPRIEQPSDAVIRITTANICGSDLHPYEGRAPLDAGMVLGHENMGVVQEVGSGVDRIAVGDRVSVPFNIACGTCRNCVAGWTCACLRGAAQVFVVDKAADRLALAGRYGATPVNFADADPVQVITDATDGAGVDCGVEAVGYQAHDAAGQEHPEMVLDKLVEVVRATGRIGVVGVYNPQDPGAASEDARQGRYGFNYGLVFDKAISMGHGQCPVKRYNHQLRDLIIRGKARPSLIASHELPLEAAPDAYKNFDQRVDGWTKVLLKPGLQAA